MTDLTGGIAITNTLNWEDPRKHELFAYLYENQQRVLVTSSITGGSGGAGGEVLQQNGLYSGHCYSLLKVEVVKNNRLPLLDLIPDIND